MKKVLIIYAHPYEKSFNNAILRRVKDILKARQVSVDIIDLYKDNFNPAYTKEELALFSKGQTLDKLVLKYQKKLKVAEELIIISPIWWSDMPGMLKGFFDKVMKQKFAYTVTKLGVQGMLTNIKKATVITTSTSPTWYLRFKCGNAIKSVLIKSILRQIGVKNGRWINCGRVNLVPNDVREKFLKSLDKKI